MILKIWRKSPETSHSENTYSASFVQIPEKLVPKAGRYRWVYNEENQPESIIDGRRINLRDWVFTELGFTSNQSVEFIDKDPWNLNEDNLRVTILEIETKPPREPNPARVPIARTPKQFRVGTFVRVPTSQFKGVSKHSDGQSFVARAMKRDKSSIYLGVYHTEFDAAGAVNHFLLEVYPEEVASGKVCLNLHPETKEVLPKVNQRERRRKASINRRRNYYRVKRKGDGGKTATSAFVGVSKRRDGRKNWNATASTPDRKNVYLGIFENELDAARAWNNFQRKTYPELIESGVKILNKHSNTGEVL